MRAKLNKLGKMIRNFIIFIALIILTFKILFKDQDVNSIFVEVSKVNKIYILVSVLAMSIYVLCETSNVTRILNSLNEKSSFLKNIEYVLIGFFFSGITPAATGGQPMQIYFMHKENISVAKSSLALLMQLTSMQFATITLALIGVIFNYKYMNKALKIFFVIGILLNACALALLLLSIYSKALLNKIIDFIIKVMEKLRIKNVDKKEEKLRDEIKKYQDGCKYIKTHKSVMVKTVVTAFIQYISLYSITYWVYRSFGLNEKNIVQIIFTQAVLYGSVSGIPSPGAVGVTEGGFIEIFKTIIPENFIKSDVILNRGVNFYLLMVIGGIITIINTLKEKKEKKEIKQIEE